MELLPSLESASQRVLLTLDSHTAGEPTRWFLDGHQAVLGGQSPAEIRAGWSHNHLASLLTTLIQEPRGAAATVGVLTVPPTSPTADLGVVFFNEAGCLGMCGHATIGLLVSLHRLGRIPLGVQWLETPVGLVRAELITERRVRFDNVPSGVLPGEIEVVLSGHGSVTGRIAWGGNWFFIVRDWPQPLERQRAPELLSLTGQLLDRLHRAGHRQVDHVVLQGVPRSASADARSFVLCPNGTYDRSPCGTGTSAWLAILADERRLEQGRVWVQEGMSGECFQARYRALEEPQPAFPATMPKAVTPTAPRPTAPVGSSAAGLNISSPPAQIVATIEGEATLIGASQLLVDNELLSRPEETHR